MKDDKLWKAFSIYIRVRDADDRGRVICATCNNQRFWKGDGMDAGHFISRARMSTKYNERNVHAQCKGCNNPAWGGSVDRVVWEVFLDKKYGKGTADLIEMASRQTKKYSKFEIDELAKYYRKEAKSIAEAKDIEL